MLRTQFTVYTVLLSFIGQPVLQTWAVDAGSESSKYKTFDEKELLDGTRNGQPIDLDAQFETLTEFAKIVAGNCTELDGSPLSVKGDGANLQFVNAKGDKVGAESFDRIVKFSAAYTSDVGIKSMSRPMNCEEALFTYALAQDNFEERRQRAVSDEEQKVQSVLLADGKSKGVGCIDCGKEEAAQARAPGSTGIEKTLSEVAAKAGDESFNLDGTMNGGTTTACVAHQNSLDNIGTMVKKVGGCSVDFLLLKGVPTNKGFSAFMDGLKNHAMSGVGGCAGDILGATLKGLWSSLKALFVDLPVLAFEGAKAGAKKVSQWMGFSKVEDAVADKQHEVAKTSESQVSKFKKDPINYVIAGLKNVVNFFLGEVTAELGCNKWSGLPYASECAEPWNGWSCATCKQVQSMVCGGIGAVASTVLASGALGAAFRGGSNLAKGMFKTFKPNEAKKLAAIVEKTKPRFAVAQGVKASQPSMAKRAVSSVKSGAERVAKTAAKTKFVSKGLEKLGKKWTQYQSSAVAKKLTSLGQSAKASMIAGWKGANKAFDFDAWPKSLALRPVKEAGKLTSDYFYAVNRAFEGRLINPFRVRSARLYDKAARQALKEEARLSTGWIATAKTVDGMIGSDIASQIEKTIHVAPSSNEAATVLLSQAKRVGTDQYVSGVKGLEKLDSFSDALKAAKTPAEKEALLSKMKEFVDDDAFKAAFNKDSARGAMFSEVVSDLRAGKTPSSTGVAGVDGMQDVQKMLRLKQAKLEQQMKNAKTAKEKMLAEREIRTFNEAIKEDYITQSVKAAMAGDAAQATALSEKMGKLGFFLDPQDLERGVYKMVHPKESLDLFNAHLATVVPDGAVKKLFLQNKVNYSKSGGVIRVKNPSPEVLKEAGFANKADFIAAVEKDATSMGLRVDKAADGISIRPKQGSLEAYASAEKAILAQMDQVGFKFDPKTRLVTPKAGDPLEVMAGGGRTGYEGVNKIVTQVSKNDPEIIATVSRNADDAGLGVTRAADEVTVDMQKMAKECNVKDGKVGPMRFPSGQ
jgi:hypothetical protein